MFQIRMLESRELCLEEVKSKEEDRPATGGEARAVLDADALLGNVEDGNAEIVVKKDVLVEEFTRSETTHEEKVIFLWLFLSLPFCFMMFSSLLQTVRHHCLLTSEVKCLVCHAWPFIAIPTPYAVALEGFLLPFVCVSVCFSS